MANQNWNGQWDSLGRSIEKLVDDAVNSSNYQQLNEAICELMTKAVDNGSEAVRRAMSGAFSSGSEAVRKAAQEAKDRRKYVVEPKPAAKPAHKASSKPVPKPMPILYSTTGSRSAAGILKTVFGSLVGFGSASGAVVVAMLGALGVGPGLLSFPGIFLSAVGAGGIAVFAGGVGNLTQLARFKQYTKLLGDGTHIRLETLAKSIGKSTNYVTRDVQKMIDSGLFLEGHMDKEQTFLITSNETFDSYETSRRELESRQAQLQRQARLQREKEESKVRNAQLQDVLDRGADFVAEIKRCNDAIPGPEISAKIFRMEAVVEKIFLRAQEHPEIVPDLKKLMDYYLPMTVKLLNAYAEMDALGVAGETVDASRREIEATLDTLNLAFEKLLDSVFRETALDVSSDISVLQTLLAQEGLTEDGLTEARRNSGIKE